MMMLFSSFNLSCKRYFFVEILLLFLSLIYLFVLFSRVVRLFVTQLVYLINNLQLMLKVKHYNLENRQFTQIQSNLPKQTINSNSVRAPSSNYKTRYSEYGGANSDHNPADQLAIQQLLPHQLFLNCLDESASEPIQSEVNERA